MKTRRFLHPIAARLMCLLLCLPAISTAQGRDESRVREINEFFSNSINRSLATCRDDDWEIVRKVAVLGAQDDRLSTLKLPDLHSYNAVTSKLVFCERAIEDARKGALDSIEQNSSLSQEQVKVQLEHIRVLNRAQSYLTSALFEVSAANAVAYFDATTREPACK
jgi:hypothetical protein